MNITYTQVGDYLIPNIILSDSSDAAPLGKYGMFHKAYLREHRTILYNQLLLTEKLYPLCRNVDKDAANRFEYIKDYEVANEIILKELVYV
jgi:hypothetical protein